jgi:hypothetical protein
MDNTPYTLVFKDEKWVNHQVNKMGMTPQLINAVIAAL